MLKRMDGKKEIWEIGICFFLMLAFTVFVGWLEGTMRADGIWTGILAYLVPGAALIIYVLKVEKSPVSSVGLQKKLLLGYTGRTAAWICHVCGTADTASAYENGLYRLCNAA